jgi:hypothetical protein
VHECKRFALSVSVKGGAFTGEAHDRQGAQEHLAVKLQPDVKLDDLLGYTEMQRLKDFKLQHGAVLTLIVRREVVGVSSGSEIPVRLGPGGDLLLTPLAVYQYMARLPGVTEAAHVPSHSSEEHYRGLVEGGDGLSRFNLIRASCQLS